MRWRKKGTILLIWRKEKSNGRLWSLVAVKEDCNKRGEAAAERVVVEDMDEEDQEETPQLQPTGGILPEDQMT